MQNTFEKKGVASNVNDAVIVKDIDEKQGIVTGYFSVFGNIDSDGDMIMPGAFKKSLSENSHRIKHLWQHSVSHPLSGTKNNRLTLKEDSYGLYFESQISQTSWGKDAIQAYVDGVVDEHSIGFRTIKERKASSYNELIELKLMEGSTVTWGANEMARSNDMKSLTKEDFIKCMDEEYKALKNGDFESDDFFALLDIYHNQFKQYFLDLTTKSTPAAVLAPEPPKGLKAEDVLLLNTTLLKTKLSIQTL